MPRPRVWLRRWGLAAAGLAVPVAGTMIALSFRSPELLKPPVRTLPGTSLKVVCVPAGEHVISAEGGWRGVETGAFQIGWTEVTVEQFCEFLNRSGAPFAETPQVVRVNEAWTPRADHRGTAVAWISAGQAEAYCAWLSRVTGNAIRLPAPLEWEIAARAGSRSDGVRGWRRAEVRLECAPSALAGPENEWGLRGIGGSLFEWCREGPDATPVALDRAWTEPTAHFDPPGSRWTPPPDYADGDTGFRILTSDLRLPTAGP